ncbi:MAG: hypothetical protein DRQ78_12895 [Epsilonproteobacteria bacterium]|nr:MAG: hypothetical protein DRQ78_12895 [Campylobacterota bacterium]
MGKHFDKLTYLKKKKEKYYTDGIKNGKDPTYGMGKGYRMMNTTEHRSKQRYGFRRYSVRQRHRVKSKTLEARRNNLKFEFYSIIKPYDVDLCFDNKDMHQLMKLIYEKYSNFESVLTIYQDGYHDHIFRRIFSLTRVLKDPIRLEFLKENYLDILHETIIRFINTIDNYVEASTFTFYTYLVNVFPYTFSSCFSSIWNLNSNMDNNVDELVGDIDVNLYSNLLSFYVYTNNMKRKEIRKYIKELL